MRLHRNITDVLNDRTTLTFFVQFLETKDALPWIKFWLDLEAFKEVQYEHAPVTRLESQNSHYEAHKFRHKRTESNDLSISTTSYSESNVDENEELQSNVGDEVDFVNKAVEPLNQSLTDDEKSKICEKKRKEVDEVDETKDSHVDLRKIQPSIFEDALRIYRKYLTNDSAYSIELPATILSKLSLALCVTEDDTDCDQKSNNLWDAFEGAQNHARDVMDKEHLQAFLESSFYCKYTVDVLTGEDLSLREILCSESALFYFMEFLEQERDCKLPYLEFWLSANNFRKQTDDQANLKSDALVIYEKWLSLQATAPLNFSNRVRTSVEEKICTMDPSIAHCFDEALLIVETYLERSCFKKFMKSQLFFKHLAEVLSKIGHDKPGHTNGVIRRNSSLAIKFPTQIRHRRTNSDSVEKKGIARSISTQNTLLAGLDKKRNKNTTDLQIDSRQLGDPDLLWHRRLSGTALSFGRVDAYGRYERDFELPTGATTIPTSKSAFQLQNGSIDVDDTQALLELDTQSRFKNAVRKLVHLPEDSLQQEIAWQVAEMIVKRRHERHDGK